MHGRENYVCVKTPKSGTPNQTPTSTSEKKKEPLRIPKPSPGRDGRDVEHLRLEPKAKAAGPLA